MAYTPPSYNVVDFSIGTSYSPPSYNAVDFSIGSTGAQTYSHTGSGGAIAAGAAAVAAVVVLLAMSGGAVAAGTADVSTTTSGQTATHVATGGALAGGSADCSRYVVSQGTGGALAGGSALSSRTLSPTTGGGALAGGDLAYSVARSFSFDGGAVAGGAADSVGIPFEPNIYSQSAAGGAIVGGLADYDFDLVAVSIVILSDGGCVAGGSSPFSLSVSVPADGGAIVAGRANVDHSPAQQVTSSQVLPSTIDTAHVKSTSPSTSPEYASPVEPVDIPTLDLVGSAEYNGWITNTNSYNGAKINIDYDANSFAVNAVLIRNFYNQGGGTTVGFTSFKLYGSNSSTDFNNTTLNSVPANGTLLRDTTTLNQDGGYGDDQVFTISNTTQYRYYILMFSGTYGANVGGVRMVELRGPIPEIDSTLSATFPSLSATGCTRTSLINPPAFSETYVKSTSDYGSIYGDQWRVVDPLSSHSGSASYAAWLTNANQIVGSKINIDYGTTGAFTANMLRLWNFHNSGSETDKGVASVRVYGSNTQADFDNTTRNSVPASGTLLLDTTAVARETSANGTEQLFWFGNSTRYRYYTLFFPTGHGHLYYTGIRKALLQGTPAPLTAGLDCLMPTLEMVANSVDQGLLPVLPYEQSGEYVTGNSLATDQTTSLTGPADGNSWNSTIYYNSKRYVSIDTGGRFVVKGVEVENYHDSGSYTNWGVNAFQVFGSNNRDDFLAPYTQQAPTCTLLYSGNAAAHVSTDTPDAQRHLWQSNDLGFRYYIFYVTSGLGGTDSNNNPRAGVRRFTYLGEVDDRPIGDIEATIAALTFEATTGAPEIVGHVSASLKRMVAQFSDGPPPSINAQPKPMTAFMVVDNMEGTPVGNLEITLPALTAENPTPAWGHLGCSFPRLNINMTGRNVVSATLKPLTCSIQGPPASVVARMVAELEALECSLETGDAITAEFPALTASLTASATISGDISATLRSMRCTMTAGADAPQEEVDVELRATMPRLSMSSVAFVGRVADIACSLRPLSFSSRGIPGIVGGLQLGLPSMRATGTGRPSWASLAATMQAITMEMETENTCSSTEALHYDEEAVQ